MDARFNLVLINARKLYKQQFVVKGDTKFLCLRKYQHLYKGNFFKDYNHETLDIIDSIKFCERCKELGVDPTIVAQNMIFDGVRGVENINKYIGYDYIYG